MKNIIDRHKKIALEFSGGRDSLATVFLLREFWDQLCVVWVNTGDAFPETLEVVHAVAELVPNFIELCGNRAGVVKAHGLPFDFIPSENTAIGQLGGGPTTLMQDRYSCCYRTMMEPAHRFVLDNGFTLVIRGQRDSDEIKNPLKSGSIVDGVELWYPLENWSTRDVLEFLRDAPVQPAAYYSSMSGCPDCMHCTAWLGEGRLAYLSTHYPGIYQEVMPQIIQLATISYNATERLIRNLEAS